METDEPRSGVPVNAPPPAEDLEAMGRDVVTFADPDQEQRVALIEERVAARVGKVEELEARVAELERHREERNEERAHLAAHAEGSDPRVLATIARRLDKLDESVGAIEAILQEAGRRVVKDGAKAVDKVVVDAAAALAEADNPNAVHDAAVRARDDAERSE